MVLHNRYDLCQGRYRLTMETPRTRTGRPAPPRVTTGAWLMLGSWGASRALRGGEDVEGLLLASRQLVLLPRMRRMRKGAAGVSATCTDTDLPLGLLPHDSEPKGTFSKTSVSQILCCSVSL